MTPMTLIRVVIGAGVAAAAFALFALTVSGVGDQPEAMLAYIHASSVLIGAGTIAAAIHGRDRL